MARSRFGMWVVLLVLVVFIVGVMVLTRPDRHDAMGDVWVTTQVQARYFADRDVRGRDIDVVTRDGVVTLTGTVASNRERQRAVALAAEVDNVRDVVDHLQLRPEVAEGPAPSPAPGAETDAAIARAPAQALDGRRPLERVDDGWITTKIQSQYFLDGDIRGRDIDVSTVSGVVTLIGDVRTEDERARAIALARDTEGVRDVNDRLRVVPVAAPEAVPGEAGREPAPETREERGVADRLDDGWITTQIQSQYFLDGVIRGLDIEVATVDGVVTLTGTVDSENARERAVQTAQQTDGVRRVEDRLTVRP